MTIAQLEKATLIAQNVSALNSIIKSIFDAKGITQEQRDTMVTALEKVRDELQAQFNSL